MKKIYLSALAIIATATISAQVLNPSFENWTAGEPDSWGNYNFAAGFADVTDGSGNTILPAAELMTGATDGNSYVKITTFNIANSTDPTNVPDGDIGSILQQTINSTDQYDSFTFDVNYDVAMNDTAIIVIQAFDAAGDIAGIGLEVFAGTQANLTSVTIPMIYIAPVEQYIILAASSEGQVLTTFTSTITPGSSLGIDNIVVGNTVSISEEVINNNNVNVYPNPANDFINVDVNGIENANITVYSVTGQEVINTTISNGTQKLNVSNLNNGVYIYAVRDLNGEVIKTNKLVVRN